MLAALAEAKPTFALMTEEIETRGFRTIVVCAGGGRRELSDEGEPHERLVLLDVDRHEDSRLLVSPVEVER